MPAYFTHLHFALSLVDRLPYAPNAVIRLYPNAYRLGALGADLLRPMGRTAAEMDVVNPYVLFEEAAKHLYESGSKCQLSYMLGMLTHYLLDSRINPYMYYLAEHGVPYYFEDKRATVRYEDIRASIDHHIVRAHLDGKQEDLIHTAADPSEVEDIAKLYERGICRAVGHYLSAKQVEKCLTEHEWSRWDGTDLTELDYLNRNHAKWETVRNGRWTSTLSLEELLDKLVPLAIKLIDDYMGRVRSGYELNERAFQINHLGVML